MTKEQILEEIKRLQRILARTGDAYLQRATRESIRNLQAEMRRGPAALAARAIIARC